MAIGSNLVIKILGDISDIKAKTGETKGFINGLSDVTDGFANRANGGFNQMADGLQAVGGSISSVGTTLTKRLSLPLAAALGAGLAAAVSYEDAFAGVKKTVDGTAAEFDQLNKSILDMSINMPMAANEIAGVMEAAGQLGIATPDLENFTRVMVDLGVSTDLSAEQAATQLARFANIMGTSSSEFENLGSAIVDLGNNFATTEPEILNMGMAIAGTGKQLNMTEGDIFGIATALTSIGINAERGGTSISKWLASMQIATTLGVKGMKEVEVATNMTHEELSWMAATNSKDFNALAESIGKTPKEMKSVVDAGTDLQKMAHVTGISVEEFAKIVEDDAATALGLFLEGLAAGNSEGDTAIEMLNDMGINQERLRDTLLRTGSAGELFNEAILTGNQAFKDNTALAEEASLRYETAASQITMMKNGFFALANEVGKNMLPTFKKVVQWITKMTETMRNMDPATMTKIVKALVALVAVGPGLKLFGGILSGVGGAMKTYGKIAGTWSKFKEFTEFNKKAKLFAMDAKTIEGGWDKVSMAMAGVRVDKAGNLFGPGAKNGPFGGAVQKDMALWTQGMKDAGKETEVFSESLVKSAGSATKLTQTPLFKGIVTGGVLALLAFWLYKTYQNSEEFREGLNKLWGAIKTVGTWVVDLAKWLIDLVTGFFGLADALDVTGATLVDFALILGGLIGFAVTGGPLGLVVAGVGAFIIAMKLLGTETEHVTESQQLFMDYTSRAGERLDELSLPIDRLTAEHMPALVSSFEEARAVFDADGALISEETLTETKDRLTGLGTDIKTYMDEHHVQMLSDKQEYHELLNMEGTTRANSEIEQLQGLHDREREEVTKIIGEIQKLEKEAFDAGRELNNDEIIERERLYHELDILALNRVTIEEKRDLASKHRLMAKLKEEGELHEDEWIILQEIEQRGWEKKQGILDTELGNRLAVLDQAVQDGTVLQEDYQKEVDKIMADGSISQAKVSAEHFATEFEKLTGANLEKYKLYQEANNVLAEYASLDEDITYARYNSLKGIGEDEIESRKEWAESFIEENGKVELTIEDLQEVMEIFSKDTTMFFEDSVDGMTLTGGAQKLLEEFGIDVAKVLPGFHRQGEYISEGLEAGVSYKAWKVKAAALSAVQNAVWAGNQYLEVRSPSKLFMRMGQFISDGLAVGITNNAFKASDSVANMAKDLSNQKFDLKSSVEMETKRNVVTKHQIQANDSLSLSMDRMRKQGAALESLGLGVSAGLVDYDKMGKVFEKALRNSTFELDDDGFVRLVDSRLWEVMNV